MSGLRRGRATTSSSERKRALPSRATQLGYRRCPTGKCSVVRRTDLSVQCSAAVRLRRALLVATAISFASIDLLHKLFDHAEFHHARSPLTAVAMAALVTALVVLVPRISSNAAAIGAGVACGGALGNLVSLLAWSQGVPDPLVLAGETQGLAFNLADLFALSGDVLLLSAAVVHGIRHRERLRERV
jgi:hypothetical protein